MLQHIVRDMDTKPLDQWIAELSKAQLPLLKGTRKELDKLGSLENITMARFSNVVLTDPGLTLTILREACAMPRSRLQDEIYTVDTAAMKLGMSKTIQIINRMRFLDDVVSSAIKQRYMQFTSRAYHAAYQAYSFARERVDMVPEELFTAAILQNIGTLMLLVHQPESLKPLTDLDDTSEQKAHFGFTLRELSLGLAKEWKLSSFIQKSMALGDGEDLNSPRLFELFLADNLAIESEKGWESEAMTALLEKIADHLHADLEQVQQDVHETAITTAEETITYGVMPVAASIPELDEKLLNKLTKTATIPLNNKAALPTEKKPIETTAPTIPVERHTPKQSPLNIEKYNAAITEARAMIKGQFNLAQFMKNIQKGFVDGLKMNRAFFAMLDHDRKFLAARFIFGTETGIRNLRIPVNNHNLFARLLDKPQALHCNKANAGKVTPLLPKEFYKLINTRDFFVMNIQVKGKTLGIIYADRYGNDHGIDKKDFEKLCQLCLVLGKGFERIGK